MRRWRFRALELRFFPTTCLSTSDWDTTIVEAARSAVAITKKEVERKMFETRRGFERRSLHKADIGLCNANVRFRR